MHLMIVILSIPRNGIFDKQNPLQTQVRINIDSVPLEIWISVIYASMDKSFFVNVNVIFA